MQNLSLVSFLVTRKVKNTVKTRLVISTFQDECHHQMAESIRKYSEMEFYVITVISGIWSNVCEEKIQNMEWLYVSCPSRKGPNTFEYNHLAHKQ